MSNRIDQTFIQLKERGHKAFIPFITAGDPDLKTTEHLVLALAKAGADIIELGIPFSDPIADGLTIQASSQRALANNVHVDQVFALVKRIRKTCSTPVAFMMYYNSIFHYGEEAFIKKAKRSGIDGLIVPDLPPEEAKVLRGLAADHDIATIFFIAPTTTEARMKKIIQASTGFIYYVSLTGVTGARKSSMASFDQIKKIKRLTDKPVCVGFGVSTMAQIKEIKGKADGVIVGSAIINEIVKYSSQKQLVSRVGDFVKRLAKATKS